MFAPPPVQLSRAEIQARLAASKTVVENGDSPKRTKSEAPNPKTSPLHGGESRSPPLPRKYRGLIHRAEKRNVSAPIRAPLGPPPEPPGQRAEGPRVKTGERTNPTILPTGFGEHPRRAPLPPERPARPPREVPLPPGPSAFPLPQSPIPAIPGHNDTSPPIPEKLPKRYKAGMHDPEPMKPLNQQPSFKEESLNVALSKLHIKGRADTMFEERPSHPSRSMTAPQATVRVSSISMAGPNHSPTKGVKAASVSFVGSDLKPAPGTRLNAGLSGVKGAKIDRTAATARRASAAASIRVALEDIDREMFFGTPRPPPRRATDGDIEPTRTSIAPELQSPWKRRRKGETLSMLLETGFFPAPPALDNKVTPTVNVRTKLPPALSVLDKDLPETPTSILATPTEMYQSAPSNPSRPVVRNRKLGKKKRSPLAQISAIDAKSSSTPPVEQTEEMSPTRLSAIPEYSTMSENSPLSSGMTTPVATQIHLRGGSVITVSPPELTAWKLSVYLQGPIKLPKPAILPRKNSVASLEPFQEVIDHVYQEALNIPRRRSDDAVVDEVCDFFDDFGFDEVSFEFDVLAAEETKVNEISEINEDVVLELARFNTTMGEPAASPVEKGVAKEIVETMSKQVPIPNPPIPPVENEETLRAKGIARLTHSAAAHSVANPSGRKDSLTLSRPSVLPLLPLPEESMLEAVLEPSEPDNDILMEDQTADQGFDWDDNVEELDSASAWAFLRRHGLGRGMSGR